MPYVVTTKRLGTDPTRKYGGAPVVSRSAVATLDEARERAARQVVTAAIQALQALPLATLACERIPESGGTVGPLPDGTLITVERVEWQTLIAQADFMTLPSPVDSASNVTEILAAFNATQGVEA